MIPARASRFFPLVLILLAVSLACLLPQRLLEGQPPPTDIPTPLPPEPTAIQPPPTPTPVSALQWQLVLNERRAEIPERNFRMVVQSPRLEGSDHPYVVWFNNLVEDAVQARMDEDLRWYAEIENPDGMSLFSDVYYSIPSREGWSEDGDVSSQDGAPLDAGQVLFDGGHPVLSILFINVYYAGGAHPGSMSWPVNYDFATGSELSLDDLFIPGAPYLERLAEYCLAQLNATLEFDVWEDGAAPLAENYTVWGIAPQGLLILFEDYQVAPYAAGPQYVLIPYAELSDLLHPAGALARFAATTS